MLNRLGQGFGVYTHLLRPCFRYRAVAGGANLICFTTGRGSVYGCKPAPPSNWPPIRIVPAMTDDMDINCGEILDGEASIAAGRAYLFS
jgi:altronate hydrolase